MIGLPRSLAGWRRRHKGEGKGMYTVMMQRARMGAERCRWMMAGGCVKWDAEQKADKAVLKPKSKSCVHMPPLKAQLHQDLPQVLSVVSWCGEKRGAPSDPGAARDGWRLTALGSSSCCSVGVPQHLNGSSLHPLLGENMEQLLHPCPAP